MCPDRGKTQRKYEKRLIELRPWFGLFVFVSRLKLFSNPDEHVVVDFFSLLFRCPLGSSSAYSISNGLAAGWIEEGVKDFWNDFFLLLLSLPAFCSIKLKLLWPSEVRSEVVGRNKTYTTFRGWPCNGLLLLACWTLKLVEFPNTDVRHVIPVYVVLTMTVSWVSTNKV